MHILWSRKAESALLAESSFNEVPENLLQEQNLAQSLPYPLPLGAHLGN